LPASVITGHPASRLRTCPCFRPRPAAPARPAPPSCRWPTASASHARPVAPTTTRRPAAQRAGLDRAQV